ncbi:HinT-interacting membrane complex lipoprotein P60 [Mycoplasma procyoni]|uniref:HinT-interacting membrane complex lipoprotein P60 n=1 Tax=Mycoplasma procyoni TaxID=568784 RepID=UPI00197C4D24|nr:hypothetical protein [Mycoplasma procyoni]MBN3534517.1 hypothetical protein [Mycoplasma procyoni]
MKNKNLIKLAFSSAAVISPVAIFASCTTTVNSADRTKEDTDLNSAESKNFIEQKLIQTILVDNWYKEATAGLDKEIDKADSKFYAAAKQAFDFYQNAELKKNSSFTTKLVSDLKAKNALNSTEIKAFELEMGPNKTFSEDSFKLLYKNTLTGIRSQVDKMVLSLNFLTNQENIKNSKRYKDYIKQEHSNYTQRRAYQSTNPETKDFFLKTLLLEKQPAQVWKFESSNNQNDISTYAALQLKDETTFNAIVSVDPRNTANTQVVKDFELLGIKDNAEIKKLLSYKGILYNQGSNSKGDLSYDVDTLKRQADVKTGFVDEINRLVYSKEDLAAASEWKGKKQLSIKLKDSFNKKDSSKFQLTKDDLEVVKASENPDVTYTIERVRPNETTQLKRAEVLVKMVLTKDKDKKNASAKYYWIDINWQSELNPTYSPSIPEEGRELQTYPEYVNVINESYDKITSTYINKIVPLFDEVQTTGEGANIEKKLYFSLDNTPWNTAEQKTILAYSLYLADSSSVYSDIKKFFEDAGYKIEYKDELLKETTK